jgi:hypothetical protein
MADGTQEEGCTNHSFIQVAQSRLGGVLALANYMTLAYSYWQIHVVWEGQ